MIPHPYTGKNLGEGVAVPSDFRLPWNTTRSMADVWADEMEKKHARTQKMSDRRLPAQRPPYAGFDPSEVQFRKHR